jgi:transposase
MTDKDNKTRIDPEVLPKAHRRKFSADYKNQILQEFDACKQPGEKGALLRREGIYSSYINTWRRQLNQGGLDGLGQQKRGPKLDLQGKENELLKREIEQLKKRLQQAELIIEVQKKVSQILGVEPNKEEERS